MDRFWRAPLPLLLVTGGLLGVTFPFAKIAADAGVAPVVWAFVIACGSGLVLLAVLQMAGGSLPCDRRSLIFFFTSAAISYAIPNLILFTVIPKLGAGYSGIMFTLSPVITLFLSLLLSLVRASLLLVGGIAVGFAGALLIAVARHAADGAANTLWLILAFGVPLSLALGNVYRSWAWLPQAGPLALAAGSNLAAALLLLLVSFIVEGGLPLAPLQALPLVVFMQLAASSLRFVCFFQLQSVGGPVYLSQIGYVAAVIGVVTGMVLFGESHPVWTWLGAAGIAVGVTLTTIAQKRR